MLEPISVTTPATIATPPRALRERFLESPFAPVLTHASLVGLTAVYFAALFWLPLWIAFVPCVFVAHRIGVLLHEYFHGIALGTYRDNHAVVTAWDGLMMTFGVLEVARGMHLAHHKWLNVPTDHHEHTHVHEKKGFSFAAAFDAVRHVGWLLDGLRGKKPFVKGGRIALGLLGSVFVVWAWVAVGHGDMVWRSLAVMAYTVIVPITLRGAIEHASEPGDPGFANEWRAFVPIFNINRHVHHHEDPTVPWYRLQWRTTRALPAVHYLTHWFGVYVWKTLVQMQPMPRRRARPRCGGGCAKACGLRADQARCTAAVR
jgi:fatty acid desaturase